MPDGDSDPGRLPIDEFDPVVHHPARLGILTVLVNVEEATFGYVKSTLNLTDGNLSRNLTILEDAGLLVVRKGYDGRRPRTWLRITPTGAAALAKEVATLRAMQEWRPPTV